jgi:hypothetical protein
VALDPHDDPHEIVTMVERGRETGPGWAGRAACRWVLRMPFRCGTLNPRRAPPCRRALSLEWQGLPGHLADASWVSNFPGMICAFFGRDARLGRFWCPRGAKKAQKPGVPKNENGENGERHTNHHST